MYTSMAERHRYREVLAYTTVVILATYLFIMGAGYYYFAQFTLSPGEYCVCFCFLFVVSVLYSLSRMFSEVYCFMFVLLNAFISFFSDDEHWKESFVPDHKVRFLS